MSRAAVADTSRAQADEPDRLEGFSAPREVERVIGHDAAYAEFMAALAGGRMHHAWLIAGPEGVGKATLAYAIARHLLALKEGGKPSEDASHAVSRKIAGRAH